VELQPAWRRPIQVHVCPARSGNVVVALGRATARGALSPVLASKRRAVRAGRPVTVGFDWSGAQATPPTVRVSFWSRGAARPVVLQRRLSANAFAVAAQR
jgi:hypothetical protein